MSLEQIFYLTQSSAAIAVLASMVFVGLEIRHNSRGHGPKPNSTSPRAR